MWTAMYVFLLKSSTGFRCYDVAGIENRQNKGRRNIW